MELRNDGREGRDWHPAPVLYDRGRFHQPPLFSRVWHWWQWRFPVVASGTRTHWRWQRSAARPGCSWCSFLCKYSMLKKCSSLRKSIFFPNIEQWFYIKKKIKNKMNKKRKKNNCLKFEKMKCLHFSVSNDKQRLTWTTNMSL